MKTYDVEILTPQHHVIERREMITPLNIRAAVVVFFRKWYGREPSMSWSWKGKISEARHRHRHLCIALYQRQTVPAPRPLRPVRGLLTWPHGGAE